MAPIRLNEYCSPGTGAKIFSSLQVCFCSVQLTAFMHKSFSCSTVRWLWHRSVVQYPAPLSVLGQDIERQSVPEGWASSVWMVCDGRSAAVWICAWVGECDRYFKAHRAVDKTGKGLFKWNSLVIYSHTLECDNALLLLVLEQVPYRFLRTLVLLSEAAHTFTTFVWNHWNPLYRTALCTQMLSGFATQHVWFILNGSEPEWPRVSQQKPILL